MTYNKPPTNYQEQIRILELKGLHIGDKDKAIKFLQNVHYYRLSGYFKSLQYSNPKDQESGMIFLNGTTFEDITNLYLFDTKLKNLILPYLNKLECSLRAKISYYHSLKYSPFGYLEKSNFRSNNSESKNYKTLYDEIENKIKQEASRSKKGEIFVKHIQSKYKTKNLPIWALVEIVSFGTLSKIFKILHSPEKKEILNEYDAAVDSSVFENWLEQLVHIRNRIAHCSRIWDYTLKFKKGFKKPRKYKKGRVFLTDTIKKDKIFFALSVLAEILKDPSLKIQFETLLSEHPRIDKEAMGIPQDWENLNPWSIL